MQFCWAMLKTQRKLDISEIASDQGHISKKYVIFVKMNSPTNFSLYVILCCVDSNSCVDGSLRDNKSQKLTPRHLSCPLNLGDQQREQVSLNYDLLLA